MPCPFYKYGQCIAVPASMAYSVVSRERCNGDVSWKTCRFYIRAINEQRKKEEGRIARDRRTYKLTEFFKTRGDLEVILNVEGSKIGKREVERKIEEVLKLLKE